MADTILDVFTPNWPDVSTLSEAWKDQWWGQLPKEIPRGGSSIASDQYLRRMELVVYQPVAGAEGRAAGIGGGEGDFPTGATSKEDGIRLSDLRVNFQVKKRTAATPNILYARIYNLSPKTMSRVKAFSRVSLSAGYWGTAGEPALFSDSTGATGGNYGMIFDGTVVMYIQGKENPTDTYLDIWAGDNDQRDSVGVINMTFPAGTKLTHKAEQIARDGFKIEVGKINIPDDKKSVRAHTCIGMARDEMRKICNESDTHYWVEQGKIYLIPFNGYAWDQAVVLSPTTGLIGMPQVTPQGVQLQCLLNPKLRLGGVVKVKSTLLSGVHFVPGGSEAWFGVQAGFATPFTATGPEQKFSSSGVSQSEQYKILLMEHHGDNRGQNWYTNITAMAIEGGRQRPINVFSRSAVNAMSSGLDPQKPSEPDT